MKYFYSLLLFATLLLGSSKTSAQLIYNRLDSISKLSSIDNIIEQGNYYHIVNSFFVFRIEKSTGIFDTIYNNFNESISYSFVDSSGSVGIKTGHKIKLYQAGKNTVIQTTHRF